MLGAGQLAPQEGAATARPTDSAPVPGDLRVGVSDYPAFSSKRRGRRAECQERQGLQREGLIPVLNTVRGGHSQALPSFTQTPCLPGYARLRTQSTPTTPPARAHAHTCTHARARALSPVSLSQRLRQPSPCSWWPQRAYRAGKTQALPASLNKSTNNRCLEEDTKCCGECGADAAAPSGLPSSCPGRHLEPGRRTVWGEGRREGEKAPGNATPSRPSPLPCLLRGGLGALWH